MPRSADLRADRLAYGGLAALCLVAGVTLVVLGSRLTFFNDEWYVLLLRPGLSADSLLEPHNGHLSVLPVLLYKGLVAAFGLDAQAPFRIALAATVVMLATLVFVYVRERAGNLLALFAAALLLFLGSAWQDLLWSFQVGLVGSLAAGVGVLLALERETRRADAVACLLLVVSIALSNLGVSFILAAAIAVLMRDRRSGLWIPGIPAFLFAVWWLLYGSEAETGFSLTNAARTPFYVLDSVAAGLASLTGLNMKSTGGMDAFAYGRPLLALVLVAAALWLVRGGRPSPAVIPIAAAALSFWALLGIDFIPGWREPDTSRYQLISVTFLILIAAELFRPIRLRPAAVAAVAAAVLVSLGSNLASLRDGYRFFRDESAIAKADLGALDIGERHVSRQFRLLQPIAGSIYMTGVYAGPYYRERDDHGSPAYSAAEIASAPGKARSAADVVLASGYELRLEPGPSRFPAGAESCRAYAASFNAAPREVELAPGGALLRNLGGSTATLELRRFSRGSFPADLGELPADAAARLAIPRDEAAALRWHLAIGGGSVVQVCRISPGRAEG